MQHPIPAVQRILSLFLSLAVLLSVITVSPSVVQAQEPASLGNGTSYYVDAEKGDDSNSGTSPSQAWKTFEPVNTTVFKPGDNILLKAGCVWEDTYLWPKGSGTEDAPITIDMYGEGSKPRINTNGVQNEEAADKTSSCVRLRDQEYVTIRNLELTNHSDSPLAATGDLRPFEDDEANNGNLNRFPFGSGEYLVGILVTITAGQETDMVYHDITVEDCYIHDVNGLRMFHSPAIDGNSKLTWTRAWERGGFDTDLWKASGGIAFTTEDPRPRQTPETTDKSELWGVPQGINNAMPPNTKDDGLHKSIYDGILIQNNRIEDVSETGIRVMQSVHLRAYTLRQVDDPLAGLHKNVVIQNNYVNGGKRWSDFGIYWACTDRALVEHNTVCGFHTSGMEDTHAQFSVAQYNEVFDIQHDYSSGAYDENGTLQYTPAQIQSGYRSQYDLTNTADSVAIDSDGASMGAIWQYNYLHDNRDGVLFCEWNSVSKNPTVVRYNIITNTGYRLIYGGTPGYIYNNTFYNALDYGQIQIAGNEHVKNNIFYLPSNQLTYSGKALESNLYAGGLQKPDADLTGITADPRFTAPGQEKPYSSCLEAAEGYRLAEDSPAIDAGTNVDFEIARDYNSGLDYFGQTVTDGLPDIGAHEFDGEKSSVSRTLVLDSCNLYLDVGQQHTMQPQIQPQCRAEYSFSSSAPEIVSVDSNGVICALAEGAAQITVEAKLSDSQTTLTALCTVNVLPSPQETGQLLTATDDATVRAGGSANEVLGEATNAYPAGSLENRQTLYSHFADMADYSRYSMIQFDASASKGTTVPRAVVRVFLREIRESNSLPTIGLYETATGWDESTLTWNIAKDSQIILNANPVSVWTGREVAALTTVNEWVEFDITDWLNAKLADPEWDGQVSFALAHTDMITDAFLNSGYTYPTDSSRKQMYQFVTKEYVPAGGNAGDCAPQLVLYASDFQLLTESNIETAEGQAPALPQTVKVHINGADQNLPVVWEPVNENWYKQQGSFQLLGHIEGCPDIVFTVTVKATGAAQPTSIAILPNTDDVMQGKGRQFTAVVENGVYGTGGEVVWSLSGQTSQQTTVSPDGFVTVGEDETADRLVLTATAAANEKVVQTAVIGVTKPALQLNRSSILFPAQRDDFEGYQKAEFVEVCNTGTGIVRLRCELKDESGAFRICQVPYTLVPGEKTILSVHARKGLAAGNYQATVDLYADDQLCQTLTITLPVVDPNAITIEKQPEATSVESGADAVFEIKASGFDLSYRWQIRKGTGEWGDAGSEDGQGYDTEKFIIPGVSAEQNGWAVRCVVTNETETSVTSEEVVLNVVKRGRRIPAPQVDSVKQNSILLLPVKPDQGEQDGQIEYGVAVVNDASQVTKWQTSLQLEGLEPGTEYWCFARITQGSVYADAYSEGVSVKTQSADPTPAPTEDPVPVPSPDPTQTPAQPDQNATLPATGDKGITGATAVLLLVSAAVWVLVKKHRKEQ